MTKRQMLQWITFAFIAATVCILLSLRSVPSTYSDNDTGRYVRDFFLFCDQALPKNAEVSQELSYWLFYSVTSPSCVSGSVELFLFEVAAFLPLTLLIFSRWRKGTFLWACALVFSVYGLELMTNAMRQSLATLFFFGSLKLVKTHTIRALLLGVLAIFAHTSVLLFFPLLLWLSPLRLSKKKLFSYGGIAFVAIAAGLFLFRSKVAEKYADFEALQLLYAVRYAESINLSFILFMVLPLYFTYGLRRHFEKNADIADEKKAVVYSSVLILASFILFPTISYRFTMIAVPMQVFLVTISTRSSPIIAGIALFGFVLHLSIILIISDNYSVLIYG